MTTQPEALLALADRIEEAQGKPIAIDPQAAAELRRLHEAHDWQYKMAGDRLRRIEKLEKLNQELLEALKDVVRTTPRGNEASAIARAAIAKATGEQS